MSSSRLTLVSYGDSRDPKTWSSAPRNIFDALTRAGCTIDPVNSLTRSKLRKGLQLALHRLAYGNWDFRRGPGARADAAARARAGIDAAGNDRILHLSVNHMPFARARPGEQHYLYLDFTYDLRVGISRRNDLSRFETTVERLDRESYAQIHHFFACSRYIRDNLIEHYGVAPEKISVIGSGLSTGFIRATDHVKNYGNGEILFSSKIPNGWEYKGGALLLEGFKIARAKNPRLHLTVVGHESYAELGRGVDGVTAYGYVSWEKLQELFDRAALYAMPALQEPWGVVYLEALACRVPVLGLNRFAFPEISQDGAFGFICPEATPEKVADTILDAMSSPDRLAAKGAAGQRHVTATFSWDRVAAAIKQEMFG